MFEVDGLDMNFDIEEYVESKTTKVEVGDNFAIVANELENGDPFYLILRKKPLPYYLTTINNEWGNTWYEGDFILGGIWYHHVLDQQRGHLISYRLLNYAPPAYIYPFGPKIQVSLVIKCHN
jgi:hypothetical protein